MKDYKRIISIILSVLMIISVMIVYPASANGAEETQPTTVVKFTDNQGWGEACAYFWCDGVENIAGNWPGKAMTKEGTNEYGQDVYSTEIPAGATKVVFNNNDKGQQTVNVTLDGAEGYYTNGSKDDKGHFNVFPWDSVPATSNETDATTGSTSETIISSDTEPQETSSETVETETTAPEYDYYMIGSEALFGVSWKIDPKNGMMKMGDGNYYLFIENAPAEKFYFKVMDKNGVPYPPQGQSDTVTTTGGETVIFCFNPEKGYAIVSTDGTLPKYPTETESTEPTETTDHTTVPATQPTTAFSEPTTETETTTVTTQPSTETDPTKITQPTTVTEPTTEKTEPTTASTAPTTEKTEPTTESTDPTTESKPTEPKPTEPTGNPKIKNIKAQGNTTVKNNGKQFITYNEDGIISDYYTFTIKNCNIKDITWKSKKIRHGTPEKIGNNKYKVTFKFKKGFKPVHGEFYKVEWYIKKKKVHTIQLGFYDFEELKYVRAKRINSKKVKINWAKTTYSQGVEGYIINIKDLKGNKKENIKIENVKKTEYTYAKLKAGKKYKVSVRLVFQYPKQKAKYYGAAKIYTV